MATEQGKPGLLVLTFDKTTWGEHGQHPGAARLVTLPYYGYQEKYIDELIGWLEEYDEYVLQNDLHGELRIFADKHVSDNIDGIVFGTHILTHYVDVEVINIDLKPTEDIKALVKDVHDLRDHAYALSNTVADDSEHEECYDDVLNLFRTLADHH